MNRNAYRLYQGFKYAVYVLLAMNVLWFFLDEWGAATHRFADGVRLEDVIEGFAASIDTAAWVILLLMFELETYVLEDRHFRKRVTFTLHSLRVICYAFIVYAFYGYLSRLVFLYAAVPLPELSDLCSLAAEQWSYAVELDAYETVTPENCGTLSTVAEFIKYRGLTVVVDTTGYVELVRLAWVDVINSAVWLLVVLLLEIDVRLQERNRLEGMALRISTALKYVLYSTLLLAAVYWGIKGEFIDFWDAFLWLVAFVFIELNVFEWRRESRDEAAAASG